jgi:hypothetical protein
MMMGVFSMMMMYDEDEVAEEGGACVCLCGRDPMMLVGEFGFSSNCELPLYADVGCDVTLNNSLSERKLR